MGYDWTHLSQALPTEILKRIASFELGEDEVGDKPIWLRNKSGKFDIKSAINIVHPLTSTGNGEWRWIWRLWIPYRVQTFLWLLQHCKLLTNAARFKRNLNSTPYCELCFEGIEDFEHLFRRCPNATEIWQALEHEGMHCSAAYSDFQVWLRQNLLGPHDDPAWSTKFSITLWYI